ncbi:FAD-binding and (Fe-S)-binding domain-containing protein [Pectinatus brassicae]|uniref:D-lactate dehydrogenase (cytochrome) n=1 Tax=Pectinatus brassicae TaxID=862415 RepID=A0A840UGI6_9FIRM|nr:FAD-binding and (Fe-S)-binding domain-containing protein [Pectinatus brassicae]MBB5336861.1 D-lactate dehydrogenase [Pectinatus brassicae]
MTAAKNIIKDINSLPTQYQEFYHSIAQVIPKERIVVDPVLTYAYGVDASLYRMTPKIVVKTRNIEEVIELINEARKKKIALNFRGAGTSLCGQSLTDSVLVVMTEGWQNHLVTDNGNKITLQAGVLGSLANLYLKPYARKIGPDPASTSHAVVAGIASNNASGMCCGVADNSYHTLVDMKLVFMDGSVLDTADKDSCQNWKQTHKELIEELENIRNEIKKDSELGQLIAHKFKIKNTTGYALNSFVDYNDPIDILKHLIIGSEGTLAVITEITYKTVIDHKYKASALMIFPDIKTACLAVMKLSRPLVFAAELLDRVSLKSVEEKEGIPSYIKDLPDKATALLVEIRTSEEKALYQQIDAVKDVLKDMHTLRPIEFTAVPKEYEVFWKIRSGIFPAVGGMREVGTTVIIEDVAFPKAKLADAVTTLRKCMDDNGYSDGIIYGHALDGSVHFVFTQAFKTEKDRLQYKKFIEDICEFVVKQYDGSLKAEHGTGRNMAPFVKFEWGEKAYKIMQRIKKAFDPERMLNPDVIITDNYELFVENIKAMPKANDIIDKCIECGYCEAHCPSHNLTLSPRQRTATQREIARLELTGENNALMERFKDEFNYLGEQTCAVDGLCQLECPLSINTGDFTKYERSLHHQTEQSQHAAKFIDEHFAGVSSVMKLGLTGANVAHSVIGTAAMNYISKKLHKSSEGKIPQWTEWMPKSGHTPSNVLTAADADKPKIIYYPSCVTRMMGPAKKDYDQRQLNDVMLSLLKKAGYAVIIPENLDKYCCGMPFESEGYFAIADSMSANLEKMLLEVTENGKYPVLCDTSPCVYRMKKVMTKKLKIYDTVEFIYDCLLDKLHLEKTDETVMLHITCSSRKMGDAEKFKAIAEACARKVVVPEKVHCCGFSGDKGFTNPELNQSALEHLNEAIPTDCTHGYSNSRTCEVGLSAKSGICYQSIAYLVDECAHN